MNKRTLLNLSLFLLVILVALLAWLEPGRQADPITPTLTTLDPASINHIRVERPAGVIELQREQDQWWLTTPSKAIANPVRINAIISVASSASLGQQHLDEEELAPYGLAQPEVRLWLDELQIDFGGKAPLDNRRYVRVGNTLHVITDLRYYQLIGDWTGYVSLQLLAEGQKLERIELPTLSLINKDGSWLPEPRPENWSADALTLLAQRWQHLQAMQVREYNTTAQGDEIRLYLRDVTEPLRFIVLAREPDLILLQPERGLAYHLMTKAEDLLGLPPTTAE
ncbi:MAG: DUF4340 domain-containing protein [Thiohalomonadaceae bacterium]